MPYIYHALILTDFRVGWWIETKSVLRRSSLVVGTINRCRELFNVIVIINSAAAYSRVYCARHSWNDPDKLSSVGLRGCSAVGCA